MGVRPSCCETPKEETSKVKKNIKKVFNFYSNEFKFGFSIQRLLHFYAA